MTLVAPVAAILGGLLALGGPANAATLVLGPNVATFGVLGGSTVTNTGPTVVHGNVGLSPGSSVTGFPPTGPGVLIPPGTPHINDTLANDGQSELTTAYNAAAAQASTATISTDLGGQTLVPGVYTSASSISLTGPVPLTLNGGSDPNAVFVFQAGTTLITGPGSTVALINVNPCNVFWQVGTSATIDTTSTFVGTVMALADISVNNGARINGRLLAKGAVTLINDTVDATNCAAITTVPTAPPVFVPPPTAAPTTSTSTSTTTTAGPTTTTAAPTTSTTVVSTTTSAAPTTTTTVAPVSSIATPGGVTPGATGPAGVGSGTPGAGPPATSSGGVTTSTPGTTSGGPATSTGTSTRTTNTGLPFTGLRATTLGIAGLAAILFGSLLLLAARRPTGSHYLE